MNFKTVVLASAALAASSSLAAFYGTGGEVTRDGDYFIHTFTNANEVETFTVTGSGEVEVLLVGGGGGGGAYNGGGGGGGQVLNDTLTLTAGVYRIVVGAGGEPGTCTGPGSGTGPEDGVAGGNGGLTEAFDLKALGGGGGGSLGKGRDGASGGGGGTASYSGAPASDSSYAGGKAESEITGHDGGRSLKAKGETYYKWGGGGGGGAGGPGTDATCVNGTCTTGSGGCGVTNDISGVALGYGGGGAGGRSSNSTAGRATDGGGTGGKGTGTSFEYVSAGKPGTDGRGGGGGGGGEYVRYYGFGGRGGCGTVIVRYRPVGKAYPESVEVTSGAYTYVRKRIDGVRYGIYTFTNNATVRIVGSCVADALLVGGGGGGGQGRSGAGGGGGGGVVTVSDYCLMDGVYDIAVGAGGESNRKGGNTTFEYLTAHGGGAGGYSGSTGDTASVDDARGGDGGCGGGGGPIPHAKGRGYHVEGGTAIWPGEGYDGGSATNKDDAASTWGGGGGGAGEKGQDAVAGMSGKGGDGRPCDITGEVVYYGGGGGGSHSAGGSGGYGRSAAGGKGGGGAGSSMLSQRDDQGVLQRYTNPGVPGQDGLGGGGGGSGNYGGTNIKPGGKGGCGVVILRVKEEPKGLLLLFR